MRNISVNLKSKLNYIYFLLKEEHKQEKEPDSLTSSGSILLGLEPLFCALPSCPGRLSTLCPVDMPKIVFRNEMYTEEHALHQTMPRVSSITRRACRLLRAPIWSLHSFCHR